MNWLSRILRFETRKSTKILDGTPTRVELDVFGLGCKSEMYYKDDTNYVRLQEKNFVLNNVIGKIGKTFSNAEFVDEDGKESALLNKLNNPNDKQSKEEFLKEFAIFLLSSGWTIVWKKYKSFGNFDTMELININPDCDNTEVRKETIITEIDGKDETINKRDLIFFYDIRKNIENDKGYSRIKPLRSQVRNIEDAQIAKGIQIVNSGVTLISPKAENRNNMDMGLETPVIPNINPTGFKTQKDDLEEKLNSRTIGNRIVFSNKGVDGYNLSESLVGLKFYDMVEPDILAIYDAFNFPPELSPYGKNSKYENRPAAEVTLIENEILPLANSFVKSMESEFPNKGNVRVSYDHLSSVAVTKNQVHDTNSKIAKTYVELVNANIITPQQANTILTNEGIL